MDASMRCHVARKGAKLGVFLPAEIREGLRTGKFKPDDDCWAKGLGEWIKVSELMSSEAPPSLPAAHPPAQVGQPSQPAAPSAMSQAAPAPSAAPTTPTQSAAPVVPVEPRRRGSGHGWRCLSCRNTLAQPIKPTSGYRTLWKSFVYFLFAMGCFFLGGLAFEGLHALSGGLTGNSLITRLGGLICFLASAVFSFMSAFEFVSAAVHHGIYRAGQPDRCPHCTSTLILKA